MKKHGAQSILLGDEGGFAPPISSVEKRLDLVMRAIKQAGYEGKIKLALDAASSEFYKNGKYTIINKKYNSGQLIDFYKNLIKKYPIVSLEDGMAEDDWKGWQLSDVSKQAALNKLKGKLGGEIDYIG